MKIVVSKNHDISSQQAANEIVRCVLQNKKSILGLATGSSPINMYEYLIKYYNDKLVSFSDVSEFNLDEYVGLKKDNKNSYSYFMRDKLFEKIDINTQNCHIPNGCADDLEKECADYDKKIFDMGGIDIQVLGIGTNGHIGFNEPSDIISKSTHVVDLAQSTIDSNSKYFDDESMPTKAITMGLATIMRAKKIILLASGSSKQDAIYNSIYGPITPKVPASLLQLHPNVVFYLDEDAASKIK